MYSSEARGVCRPRNSVRRGKRGHEKGAGSTTELRAPCQDGTCVLLLEARGEGEGACALQVQSGRKWITRGRWKLAIPLFSEIAGLGIVDIRRPITLCRA